MQHIMQSIEVQKTIFFFLQMKSFDPVFENCFISLNLYFLYSYHKNTTKKCSFFLVTHCINAVSTAILIVQPTCITMWKRSFKFMQKVCFVVGTTYSFPFSWIRNTVIYFVWYKLHKNICMHIWEKYKNMPYLKLGR